MGIGQVVIMCLFVFVLFSRVGQLLTTDKNLKSKRVPAWCFFVVGRFRRKLGGV